MINTIHISIIYIIHNKLNIKNKIGIGGEYLSKKYLEANGYVVLAHNYLVPKIGEIDLIALKEKVVVFVEVKTRKSETFGLPYEAVNSRKVRKCMLAASYFVDHYLTSDLRSFNEFRFDVITIVLNPFELCHFENVY